MPSRREGFAHQKLIVLPEAVVREAMAMPLLRGLLPVAAGYFPRAEGHLVVREVPVDETIVLLCVAGRGWVRIGAGKAVSVGAECLVVIPPGAVHAYGAREGDPWTIHWAHLRGEDVGELCKLLPVSATGAVMAVPGAVELAGHFERVEACLEEDYTLANLLSASAWLRLGLTEAGRRGGGPAVEARPDPVGLTLTWMQDHLGERTRLDHLAGQAGLSPAHYSAQFRRRTGYAPVDYFLRLKVRHACRLLDNTTMRVEDIAESLGYDDAFYFSRLFRRVMAMSPRDYRQVVKG